MFTPRSHQVNDYSINLTKRQSESKQLSVLAASKLGLYQFLKGQHKKVIKPVIVEQPKVAPVEAMSRKSMDQLVDDLCPRWDIDDSYSYLLDSDTSSVDSSLTLDSSKITKANTL